LYSGLNDAALTYVIAATNVDLSIMITVNSSTDLIASPNGDMGANLGATTDDYIAWTLKAATRPDDDIITDHGVRLGRLLL
jgi:hypothetical protein